MDKVDRVIIIVAIFVIWIWLGTLSVKTWEQGELNRVQDRFNNNVVESIQFIIKVIGGGAHPMAWNPAQDEMDRMQQRQHIWDEQGRSAYEQAQPPHIPYLPCGGQ